MGRKLRIFIADQPQHVILEGFDELDVFVDEEDLEKLYATLLRFSSVNKVKIHSYVLTKRFIEMLVTPRNTDSLAKFMQSFGRSYVHYYNAKHGRSGRLFKGRYKCSGVEAEVYLLSVMNYIDEVAGARSSRLFYSENKIDDLVAPHALYLKLGNSPADRFANYLLDIAEWEDNCNNDFIKQCLDKQLVTGSVTYIKNLEELIGQGLLIKKRGRPPKPISNKENTMYQHLTPLNKKTHKEFKVKPLENLNFAKGLHYLPVLATEAVKVSRDFPVVFTFNETENKNESEAENEAENKTAISANIIALVSLGSDNLAINEDGKWICEYVPTHLRKFPFALASSDESAAEKIILLDEGADLISKTEGSPLFNEEGEATETLDHAIEFLKSFDEQAIITQNVANVIAKSEILVEQEITIDVEGETKVLVNGFKVVDREKFNQLDDETLADWTRKGIVALIEAHLVSLDNISKLFNLAAQKQN